MTGTKRYSVPDCNSLIGGSNAADGVASGDLATVGQVSAGDTSAKSRANHTGTQTASTISDFDTQVRTSRLDQMAAPTSSVNANNQRVTSLGSASADTDAAQWGQVKDLLSGRRKADVRAVMTTNVNVSSPGTSFDGQTFNSGDSNKRLLLTGQTAPAENGIYDWTAGASALTRASDADTAAEFGTAWLVTVVQGTANADTVWQNNTDGAITLNTTALVIGKLGPISAASNGYTTTCPSTSAGGTWTVTHNLGTRAVIAQVYRVASPYDLIDVYIGRPTANTVEVKPDSAFASGEFEINVIKIT